MAQAPFTIQPQLTAISLTYKNRDFIAERVLPRVPVLSQSFKWSKFTLADGFTIPDTRVGRKSAPGQIDWTAAEQSDTTVDFGLEDAIPQADIQHALATQKLWGTLPIDPMARSTTVVTQLIATNG